MKKIVLFGLVCVMAASNANAGWFGDLFKKTAEPTTLSEACNTDEITSICPEVALGEKTLTQCLSENVKSLSKKCSKFVKKSIKENKELVLGEKDSATTAAGEQVNEAKATAATAKQTLKNKKTQIKADAKAAAKEIKDTATAVKNDAIETGKSLKEIAK